MSIKRPVILRALSRPLTIFGMHSKATILNLIINPLMGFMTDLLLGIILFGILQLFIAILTRRDRYFAEVYYRKFKMGKTRNLNPLRKGNYYAV